MSLSILCFITGFLFRKNMGSSKTLERIRNIFSIYTHVSIYTHTGTYTFDIELSNETVCALIKFSAVITLFSIRIKYETRILQC